MRLSELQLKEIINISNGKRIGIIVDVIVSTNGQIEKLVLEEKRGRKFSKEEYEILWNQIIKIGDDIYICRGKAENVVRSISNPDYCTLTVNGMFFADKNGQPFSLMLNTMALQD